MCRTVRTWFLIMYIAAIPVIDSPEHSFKPLGAVAKQVIQVREDRKPFVREDKKIQVPN